MRTVYQTHLNLMESLRCRAEQTGLKSILQQIKLLKGFADMEKRNKAVSDALVVKEADEHEKKKIAEDSVSSVLNLPIVIKHPVHPKDVSGSATVTTTSQLQTPIEAGESSSTPSGKAADPQPIEVAQHVCGAGMFEPLATSPAVEEEKEKFAKYLSGSATATTTSQLHTPDAKSRKQVQASGPSSLVDPVESFIDAVWCLSGEAAVRQSMAVQDLIKKASGHGLGMVWNFPAMLSEFCIAEEARHGDGASMSESLAQPHYVEKDQEQAAKDVSGSAIATTTSQLQTPNKAGGSSITSSGEAAVPQTMAMQIRAMQDMMNKLMDEHEELQKQMAMMKAIEANNDPMWAQLVEKISEEVTGSIDDFVKKHFGVMLEKKVKNELADFKEAFASAIIPAVEQSQTVPLVVSDYCQSEVDDKAVNQLEQLVNSELQAFITQFQTLTKLALEDALRSSLESSVVPPIMRKFDLLFDPVAAELRKRIDICTTAPQLHSVQSSLADASRKAMSSASSVTQTVSRKLAVEQHKLGDLASKTQLSRLVSERKYNDAFRSVLVGDDGGDISLLSWLCTQVNLHDILSLDPIPLRVSVIISVHARLRRHYNINHDASVVEWMSHLQDALERVIVMGSLMNLSGSQLKSTKASNNVACLQSPHCRAS